MSRCISEQILSLVSDNSCVAMAQRISPLDLLGAKQRLAWIEEASDQDDTDNPAVMTE